MSAVDRYLADLDASLRGSRRRKGDLLHEAADHLVDATEAHESAGLSRQDAERRAVREFGDTATVAPGYQAILSVEHNRRLGIWLFVVVLAQPFAWGGWNSADVGPADGPVAARLDDLVETAGLVALAFAAFVVVGCGLALRVLGVREWLLRLTATSSLVSSVLIAAISVAMYATSSPGGALALAFISVVVWIPMSVIAVRSVVALRAVDAANRLS